MRRRFAWENRAFSLGHNEFNLLYIHASGNLESVIVYRRLRLSGVFGPEQVWRWPVCA